MTTKNTFEIGFDEFDEIVRPAPAVVDFDNIAEASMSRRSFLGGGAAFGATAFVMGSTTLSAANAVAAGHDHSRLAFEMVKANALDTVTVPKGYSWQVVTSWGDPLWSKAPELDKLTGGTGESQEMAFGDHNDGMAFFRHDGKNILAVNNEYTNYNTLLVNREGGVPTTADDIRKSKAAHGVSIVEISQQDGKWSVVKDSMYNRRITADTEMSITGPARGHELLKTAADPKGEIAKGTWNN